MSNLLWEKKRENQPNLSGLFWTILFWFKSLNWWGNWLSTIQTSCGSAPGGFSAELWGFRPGLQSLPSCLRQSHKTLPSTAVYRVKLKLFTVIKKKITIRFDISLNIKNTQSVEDNLMWDYWRWCWSPDCFNVSRRLHYNGWEKSRFRLWHVASCFETNPPV